MLHSLFPQVHCRFLSLPLLGPVADGFDDWLACGYREFRPYLNQHPCGTLIADLVDELATMPTIVTDLEDWEPLPHTVDEYFQVQGVRSAKESGYGSAKVWSARSRRNGIFA
jgi:hypothetical protein